jgi:hypothetical protein
VAELTEVAVFPAFCLCAVAAGVGLLQILGYPRDLPSVLFLAPVTISALWVLAGNVLLRTGHTLRQATPPLWALTLVLALVGLLSLGRRWRQRNTAWRSRACLVTFGATALTVGLLAWALFTSGPARHVPHSSDALNYTVVAGLAWQHGLDLAQPRPPIEQQLTAQFGALASYRNYTVVLLAFLSPLIEAGEPVTVINLFVWWSFVVLASSLAFYEVCRRQTAPAPSSRWTDFIRLPAYVVVTMGIGWAVVPSAFGSWDNIVAVHLCPVLAGLALRAAAGLGYALLLGSLAAYGVYGYTELAPAVLLLLLPFFVWSVLHTAAPRRPWLGYGGAAVIASFWLAPGLRKLAWFLWYQWTYARGVVGSGFAAGLVEHATSPAAWWALGPEHLLPIAGRVQLVAIALTLLVVLGVVRIARRGALPELSAFGLGLAATFYLVLVDRYSYGAYKMLTVSWWLWGLLLAEGVCGFLALSDLVRKEGPRRTATVAVTLGVIAVIGGGLKQARVVREAVFFPEAVYRRQPTVKSLRQLRNAGRREPPGGILLAGDERARAGWSAYAFRSTALTLFHVDRDHARVPGSRPWMPDASPLAGIVVPATWGWMYAGLPRRFETPDFALIQSTAGALLEDVQSPNGIEDDGMWLGTRGALLTILADRSTRAALAVDAVAGPGARMSVARTLSLRGVAGELGQATFERRCHLRFELDLPRGPTYLVLSTPDVPDQPSDAERIVRIKTMALEPALQPGLTR